MNIINIEGNTFEIDIEGWKDEIIYKINQNIKNESELNLDNLYDECIKDIRDLLETVSEIDESICEKLINNKTIKKHRWVKNELDSENSPYNIHLKAIKEAFESPDTCIKQCTSFQEYKSTLENELINWKKNKDLYVTTYMYYNKRNKKSRKSAILIDMKIDILKKVIESENNKKLKNSNKQYEFQINSLTNLPIDTTNKVKLTQQNENSYIYSYESENNQLQYFINLDDIKNVSIIEHAGKAIEQVFKVINDNDIKLFEFILKNRTSTFFQDGKVPIIIKEACIYVFDYFNNAKKKSIISSLIKMSSLKIYAFSQKNGSILDDMKGQVKGLTTSLLSNDLVFDNDAGRNVVTVIVSDIYRSEIINGNITKVYSHILEKVKDNPDAKKILFFLQRERIIKYYNRDKDDISNDYLKVTVHYTYFSQSIVFTNKRKDAVKKRIQKVLDLIITTDSVLKVGYQRGDYFILEYNPMTSQEILDLENRIIK